MEDLAHQLFVTSDPLIADIIRNDILCVRRQSEARTMPSSLTISHLYKTDVPTDNNGNNEMQDGEDDRSEDNWGEDGGSEGRAMETRRSMTTD